MMHASQELARRRAEAVARDVQLVIWSAVSGEAVTIIWLDEQHHAEVMAAVEAFLARIGLGRS